jgi:hypothetical protein
MSGRSARAAVQENIGEAVLRECGRAFAMDHDACAEHLVKIIGYFVRDDAPAFAKNPQHFIAAWKAQRPSKGAPA